MIDLIYLLEYKFLYDKSKLIFLMDNASYHKTQFMKKAYELLGVKVLLNAPYSPKGNPIEMLFSLIKFIANEEEIFVSQNHESMIKLIVNIVKSNVKTRHCRAYEYKAIQYHYKIFQEEILNLNEDFF